MKQFKEHYSRDQIINFLCKIRISYANKRHKKVLLDNLVDKKNHLSVITSEYDEEIVKQLNELLPPRRQWLTNGFNTFKPVINKTNSSQLLKKIDTDVKNRQILFYTIKRHSKNKSKYAYQSKLDAFVNEIQSQIINKTYKIAKPDIVPEVKETSISKKKYFLKKGEELECRPISRFQLKDRIVISITNKFLTNAFDVYFESSSLAFRAINNSIDGVKNHHLAITKIIDYKEKHGDNDIYVAECDMKKFYDTVNHEKTKIAFQKLIERSKSKYPLINFAEAEYLFYEYLNCYSFEKNIDEELNGNKEYWDNQKDANQNKINGCFPWIKKDIKNSEYYRINKNDRIGVPQGGALSGLIANILLDYSDKKLNDIPNLFYVRYCDDMILMHTDKQICSNAINIYKESINELLLFNHDFETVYFKKNKNYLNNFYLIPQRIIAKYKKSNFLYTINNSANKFIRHLFPKLLIRAKKINSQSFSNSFEYSLKPFWNCKSKGPYKWGQLDFQNNSFPWIGFVGYEIDYNCNTRIRKRSLKKEMLKQKKVITSIIKRIIKENYKYKKARNNAIYRSAFEKLNGMSVGRIKLYNYKTCENKICWADGFKCLNLNKFSKIQLRKLDRNKNMFLNILVRNLGHETVKSNGDSNTDDILKLGKPFSYYYQAGEKKNGV